MERGENPLMPTIEDLGEDMEDDLTAAFEEHQMAWAYAPHIQGLEPDFKEGEKIEEVEEIQEDQPREETTEEILSSEEERRKYTRKKRRIESPKKTKIKSASSMTNSQRKKWNKMIQQEDISDRQKRKFHNPDALARLVGPRNEAIISLEGTNMRALLDSGAQVSSISETKAKELGLHIKPLKEILEDTDLELTGTGGSNIPITGIVEATLQLEDLPNFCQDIILVSIKETPYHKTTPVILGTPALQMIFQQMGDRTIRNEAWNLAKQTMSLGVTTKDYIQEDQEEDDFNLNSVKGTVKATKTYKLLPLQSMEITGITRIPPHQKRLCVMVEESKETTVPKPVEVKPTYTWMEAESNKVRVTISNNSNQGIYIRKGTILGEVTAANKIPDMWVPVQQEELDEITQKREQQEEENSSPERILAQMDLTGMDEWPEELQEKARDILKKHWNMFAKHDYDLGRTNLAQHKIKLTDYTPFKERHRRIPPQLYEQVKKNLKEMISVGAIRPSKSAWASPVVLVAKKDGGLRFCIDLRGINKRTVRDAYSLPRIEESLDSLRGSELFSTLDLKWGYWQVEMEEESKQYTAFTVGPLGFYECQRMPFGLTNAPATFQRLMENCLGDLHLSWCIIYLDDIVIYSKTIEEQLERLDAVLDRLEAAGLKLKASKCEFFKLQITYLGHVVSKDGIATDPSKIEAVKEWPIPRDTSELRRFLGFASYYRRFISKFSQKAKPLNDTLKGSQGQRKVKIEWNQQCQDSFDTLKKACTELPVLAYADFSKPFKLQTDASGLGLGAVLYQEHENKDRVIAYASRSLSDTESRYAAYKLEFLALRWAVCVKFKDYLFGSKFEVYTDNNPLLYIQTTAKLDAIGQRWVADLSNYNFSLHYKPGTSNKAADALSRIQWPDCAEDKIPPEAVQSICFAALVDNPPIQSLTGSTQVQELVAELSEEPNPGYLKEDDWREIHRKDPVLARIQKLLQQDRLKSYRIRKTDPPELAKYMKRRSELTLHEGVVHRRTKRFGMEEDTLQLVLPKRYHRIAFQVCHDKMGHLGRDRTLTLIKDRFSWPGMERDVKEWLKTCDRCMKYKRKQDKAPLEPIFSYYPLQLINIDYLSLEASQGYENVLVITDHFTRFAQAYPTKNQTALTTAKVLWKEFIVHYGFPEQILSDQGGSFEGELFKELCRLAGTDKLRTTPYHPQCNGQVERFNRTLMSMLGTLGKTQKTNWKDHLSSVVHAYNCTKSTSTGFSPYYLMFGRQPRLPVDVLFNLPARDDPPKKKSKFVQHLRDKLRWAYKEAQAVSEKEAKRNKKLYDKKATYHSLQEGDKVLLREVRFTSRHKIQDKWGSDIYTIVKVVQPGMPMYDISAKIEGKEIQKRVHRNLLLPILQEEEHEEEEPEQIWIQEVPTFGGGERVKKPQEIEEATDEHEDTVEDLGGSDTEDLEEPEELLVEAEVHQEFEEENEQIEETYESAQEEDQSSDEHDRDSSPDEASPVEECTVFEDSAEERREEESGEDEQGTDSELGRESAHFTPRAQEENGSTDPETEEEPEPVRRSLRSNKGIPPTRFGRN